MVATKKEGERGRSYFLLLFFLLLFANVTLASSVTRSAYIHELCRAGGFATDGRGPAPASAAAAVAACIIFLDPRLGGESRDQIRGGSPEAAGSESPPGRKKDAAALLVK